jgi:hypothetical protein
MLSQPFAAILAAGRNQFNQRVSDARRRHALFDAQAFAAFLQTCVDPVVRAVAASDAARASATALAAYDLALDVVGTGTRSALVASVWRELAPTYARLIGRQPGAVLGLLSNAALYLESIPHARGAEWLGIMVAMSSHIDTMEQLQGAGQMVAWRCGVAHFRDGALAAGARLPEPLALAALGGEAALSWAALRARLIADPWWRPDGPAPARVEIGAFTGLGGHFGVPPEVHAHPHGFTARCGDAYHLLVADAFGAVLHPSDAAEHGAPDAVKGDWKLRDAVLYVGTREIALDVPAQGIKVCCNGPTLAITSPYTHAIRLVPAR